jgi:hypothetical protein
MLTWEEIQEWLARLDQLSADELTQLDEAITTYFNEASAVEPPTAESVAQMAQAQEARTTVTGEVTARENAQAELDRQAEELRQQFNQDGDGTEGDGDGEGDGEGEGSGDGDGEGEGEGEGSGDGSGEGEGDGEGSGEPEAVAASAPAAPAQRRPAPVPLVRLRNQPRPGNRASRRAGARRIGLTAAGDAPGFSAGQQIPDWHALAPALAEKIEATKGAQGEWRVASMRWEYDDAHTLDGNGDLNSDKIKAAQAEHSQRISEAITASLAGTRDELTAAGGLCAPLAPYYDLMTVSEATRPVRDSLVQFGATRGGISGIAAPQLGDLDAAVTQWTVANDTAATAGAPTKPCVRVACGNPWTAELYAVPLCLEFGVLGARTFPEQVEANNTIGLATHARFSETLLLSAIDGFATDVTLTDTYGGARALLSILEIMRAGLINRHRAPQNTRIRVALPAWGRAWIRTDIARQLATDASENSGGALAVTDAEIDNMLAVRNIVPTWHEDGVAGELFAAQAAGALEVFPATMKVRMWFDGGILFLDGGRLDIGVYRDSDLVATNDYKQFFEVFEAVAHVGPEALSATLTAVPSGASGGTVVAAAP